VDDWKSVYPEPHKSRNWGLNVLIMIGVGVSAGMGQYLMSIGVARTSAHIASLIVFVGLIVFSFVFQVLFFNQMPNVFTIIGALFMIGALMCVYLPLIIARYRIAK
jgi:drug/metabolite transporter (DMT)-like permease